MISQALYWLSRPAIGLYGRMLKLDVLRHARLPKGPKIVVANHPTTSDPFLVAHATGQPARMLVIDHAFKVPGFGTYLRKSRHIPVVPGEGRRAFETAREHLDAGGTMVLFPEGELSPRQGGFHRPHTGAARLALLHDVPVIPMGISLSKKGLWYLESDIDDEWVVSRWALRGPYGLTVGEALHFSGDAEDRPYVTSVTRIIMQKIIDLSLESERRINAPLGMATSALSPVGPSLLRPEQG